MLHPKFRIYKTPIRYVFNLVEDYFTGMGVYQPVTMDVMKCFIEMSGTCNQISFQSLSYGFRTIANIQFIEDMTYFPFNSTFTQVKFGAYF